MGDIHVEVNESVEVESSGPDWAAITSSVRCMLERFMIVSCTESPLIMMIAYSLSRRLEA
jgi:hypothetical protein